MIVICKLPVTVDVDFRMSAGINSDNSGNQNKFSANFGEFYPLKRLFAMSNRIFGNSENTPLKLSYGTFRYAMVHMTKNLLAIASLSSLTRRSAGVPLLCTNASCHRSRQLPVHTVPHVIPVSARQRLGWSDHHAALASGRLAGTQAKPSCQKYRMSVVHSSNNVKVSDLR